jgi:adenylate kinase
VKQRLVLLGPPVSGKGTLTERLCREFGFQAASPGAMLREESPNVASDGKLLCDDVINSLVGKWLDRQTGNNFVFDGYPRTMGQGKALDTTLAKRKATLDMVVLLEADEATLKDRVEKRAGCRRCRKILSIENCPCGGDLFRRSDDTVEVLEKRLSEYSEKTEPLIGYYEDRGLLQRFDATQPADAVYETVRTTLLA